MKDDLNEDEVKENMVKYHALLSEFKEAHVSHQLLLNEEDSNEDNDTWFKPKVTCIDEFIHDVTKWLRFHQQDCS